MVKSKAPGCASTYASRPAYSPKSFVRCALSRSNPHIETTVRSLGKTRRPSSVTAAAKLGWPTLPQGHSRSVSFTQPLPPLS